MVQVSFSRYDLDRMREWGVSAAEDTRTRAEAEERLVLPEWLRRAMWRQFWADQDALFGAANVTSGTRPRQED